MSTATLIALFVSAYALTGVALGGAIVLGIKRHVPGHVKAVVAFVVGFAITIAFAVALGLRLSFEPEIMRIHRMLATSGTVLMLAPIVTGIRRYRTSGSLAVHRVAVVTFLLVFTGASVTGGMMLATGKPRDGTAGVAATTSGS